MDQIDTQIIEQTLDLMDFEDMFHSRRYLDFTIKAYKECVPLQFYILPASSSGKYHPSYALGIGGLVRHTKAAIMIARILFPLYHFSEKEEDQILSALALHDIAKPSKLHPIEVEPLLDSLKEDYYSEIQKVVELIESHMGQWDQFGKLPRPTSTTQRFVHLCDFLASRKPIQVDINYKGDKT